MTKADDPRRAATDGVSPGYEDAPAPGPIKGNGQHSSYWILGDEERAKGFVRPLRRSYKHVGPTGPAHPTRDLTAAEHERYDSAGYALFEQYPPELAPVTGRFWTRAELDAVGKGCGTVTTMGLAIAETYARQPTFYGATFCCGCGTHLPVGKRGVFVWVEPDGRTSTEKVGT